MGKSQNLESGEDDICEVKLVDGLSMVLQN